MLDKYNFIAYNNNMQPTNKQIIKVAAFTFIFAWLFKIDSFWLILGLSMVLLCLVPIWDKEEAEFQKDIKDGNDLKKWYIKFPYRAPHHQAKQDINRWINKP
jgi:hypothetical protein